MRANLAQRPKGPQFQKAATSNDYPLTFGQLGQSASGSSRNGIVIPVRSTLPYSWPSQVALFRFRRDRRMELIDRRGFARGILFGAAAAGLALSPTAATAMTLDARAPSVLDDWIMKAEAVVVRPGLSRRRPRRRIRRCWWNRGRRVCGWRWV